MLLGQISGHDSAFCENLCLAAPLNKGGDPAALVFNLRMDPFEKHDGWKSQEIAMKLGVAWGGQVQDALAAHLKSLQEFPPRQKGGTLTPRP